MSDDEKADVFGGAYYSRRHPGAKLERIGPVLGDAVPDAWICRRVLDFPEGLAPPGSCIGICARCQSRIAYDPRRILQVPPSTPQICMQCAGVKPLPIRT